MKFFKSVLSLTIAVFFAFPLFAMDQDFESKLLEKALIEGAVTKEQKSAVAHFLSSVAAEKRKLAASYRESAVVSRGGKALTQEVQSKRLLEMAKALEAEAKSYDSTALIYDSNAKLATN